MKKGALLFTSVVCALTVGCSQNTKEADSLKEAYFYLGEKIEQSSNINVGYVKSLLNGYTYEEGNLIEDESTNYKAQLHVFTTDNEKLILSDASVGDNQSLELYYNVYDDLNEISFSYTPISKDDALLTNVVVADAGIYTELSLLLDIKETERLNYYNRISQSILSPNDMTIDEVKVLTNMEPTAEDWTDSNTSLDLTSYYFSDGTESLVISTLKDDDKVSRVTYGSNNVLFLKNTIDPALIPNSEQPLTLIISSVDSLSIQEQVINKVIK